MAEIELQGVNQMLERLRAYLGNGAERVENKALREAGERIAEAQRTKIVASNKEHVHMRDDIHVSPVQKKEGIKYVNVGPGEKTSWRGHFLEFGTKKASAQPFIYPAFHEQKEAVKTHLAHEFRKGVKG